MNTAVRLSDVYRALDDQFRDAQGYAVQIVPIAISSDATSVTLLSVQLGDLYFRLVQPEGKGPITVGDAWGVPVASILTGLAEVDAKLGEVLQDAFRRSGGDTLARDIDDAFQGILAGMGPQALPELREDDPIPPPSRFYRDTYRFGENVLRTANLRYQEY